MPWPFFSAEIITSKLSFSLSLGIIATDCFPVIVTDKVVTCIIAPQYIYV